MAVATLNAMSSNSFWNAATGASGVGSVAADTVLAGASASAWRSHPALTPKSVVQTHTPRLLNTDFIAPSKLSGHVRQRPPNRHPRRFGNLARSLQIAVHAHAAIRASCVMMGTHHGQLPQPLITAKRSPVFTVPSPLISVGQPAHGPQELMMASRSPVLVT